MCSGESSGYLTKEKVDNLGVLGYSIVTVLPGNLLLCEVGATDFQ